MKRKYKFFFSNGATVLYISTADDMAFKTIEEANNHNSKLSKSTVKTVYKAEFDAWYAKEAPRVLDIAKTNLEIATKALKEAENAVNELPKVSRPTDTQRSAAIEAAKGVSNALQNLANVTAAYNAAKTDVDNLPVPVIVPVPVQAPPKQSKKDSDTTNQTTN